MPNQDEWSRYSTDIEDNEGVESLSNYISKHLQNRQADHSQQEESTASVSELSQELYPAFHLSHGQTTGRILHHYDSQLSNDHLEQYLPTPAIRLHIMRGRLNKELNAIYTELNQYSQLDGVAYQSKVEALEERAYLLKRKIFDLDIQISNLNPLQAAFKKLQKLTDQVLGPMQSHRSGWVGMLNRDPLKEEIAETNTELASLQQILANHVHDPSFTPEQLARLVYQYDAKLKYVERLIDDLKHRKNLGARLGDKMNNWMQSFLPAR